MLVHLRLEKQMVDSIDTTIQEELYKTKSEFIRDAIRKSLEEYELKRSLSKIKSLQGSVKPLQRLSRRENFLEFEKTIRSQDKQE